jgi:hypothetical protein
LQSQLQALQRDAGEIDSFLAEVSLAGAAGAHAVVYPALFDVAAATASPMKHAGHVQVSQGVGERWWGGGRGGVVGVGGLEEGGSLCGVLQWRVVSLSGVRAVCVR